MGSKAPSIAIATLLLLAAFAVFAIWFWFPAGEGDQAVPMTAVIIDQLRTTSPDQPFVDDATRTLRNAGYTVDYVAGSQVTVDYYRHLPERDYGLVIVRGHSGLVLTNAQQTDELRSKEDTFLFTSEPYSEDAHSADQSSHRLSVAYYLETGLENLTADELVQAFKNEPRYFGVKPSFIKSSTRGRFHHTTVVLMGCNGLRSDSLANAFIAKGASVVVGWDELVTAQHTDDATERLLSHMLVDKLPAAEAVARTAAEVGPDPTYGGKLTVLE
jgi:hypothetical protein